MFLHSRDKLLKTSLSKNFCLKTRKESIQGNIKVESIDSLHQQIRELQEKLATYDKKKSIQGN
jgi:hypothetical protein